MNTEQLKTAKEFLREASGSIRADEYHLINVMNSFASQESNKALSEFKEKFKVEASQRGFSETDYNGKILFDLIDKL